MRTSPGVATDPPAPRSRKPSSADLHRPSSSTSPTSFFLASETDLEKTITPAAAGSQASRCSPSAKPDRVTAADSVYGVQSLQDAVDEAFGNDGSPRRGNDNGDGDKLHTRVRRRDRRSSYSKSSPSKEKGEAGAEYGSGETAPQSTAPFTPKLAGRYDRLQEWHRQMSHTTISQPLTPLTAASPALFGSAGQNSPRTSSIRSLQLSEDEDDMADENASQALVTSDEEDDPVHMKSRRHRNGLFSPAPELVMPSLSMPSRRPFTTRGRQMGRLKLCVAGSKGAGKTSLIRAVLQQCQDIVHIDPVVRAPKQSRSRPPRSASDFKERDLVEPQMTEISASTRAYPAWRSDLEENRSLRRRKSMESTILERNLNIVDTSEHNSALPDDATQDHVVEYLESLFRRNCSLSSMSDKDILDMLTGHGGVQVDVLLFVFSADADLSVQVEQFKRLTSFTNVVPVLGKADLLTAEVISELKQAILDALPASASTPFLFSESLLDELDQTNTTAPTNLESSDASSKTGPKHDSPTSTALPYAISTIPGLDEQEMDASLLMSSSYSPPLIPSELQILISQLFDPENVSWFRYNAVRKFLAWRARQPTNDEPVRGDALFMHSGALGIRHMSPLIDPPSSQLLVPRQPNVLPKLSPFNMTSAAILGRGRPEGSRTTIVDQMRREESAATMQVSRWAAELQSAMRQEREQFESLVKGDRAKWLLEKINDEVRSGTIGAIDSQGVLQSLSAIDHSRTQYDSTKASQLGNGPYTSRAGKGLPTWSRNGVSESFGPDDELDYAYHRHGAMNTFLKAVGGGVIATFVYFAVVGVINRLSNNSPEPYEWAQAPRWLNGLIGRAMWPDEPQMWV